MCAAVRRHQPTAALGPTLASPACAQFYAMQPRIIQTHYSCSHIREWFDAADRDGELPVIRSAATARLARHFAVRMARGRQRVTLAQRGILRCGRAAALQPCCGEAPRVSEVSIRALGGLLGAHTVSQRPHLLDAARDIGERLSRASVSL